MNKQKVDSETQNPRKRKRDQKVCSGIFLVIFISFHIFEGKINLIAFCVNCNCNIYDDTGRELMLRNRNVTEIDKLSDGLVGIDKLSDDLLIGSCED